MPIPAEVAPNQRRVVIGEADPTRDDVRPCEYLVRASRLYPGRPTFSALVELDDDDRALLAKGARIWLTLDGAEVPWSIEVADAEAEA